MNFKTNDQIELVMDKSGFGGKTEIEVYYQYGVAEIKSISFGKRLAEVVLMKEKGTCTVFSLKDLTEEQLDAFVIEVLDYKEKCGIKTKNTFGFCSQYGDSAQFQLGATNFSLTINASNDKLQEMLFADAFAFQKKEYEHDVVKRLYMR